MFGSEVPFGKPKFWSSAAETVTRPCERTQRRRAVHLTVVVTLNFVKCVLTTVYVFPVSDLCFGSDKWRAVSHLISAAQLGQTPCRRKSSRWRQESGT